MPITEGLELLKSRLIHDYGEQTAENIIHHMNLDRVVSFRVNTIKTNKVDVLNVLNKQQLTVEQVPWYPDAFVLTQGKEKDLEALDIYQQGHIYLQSLSSMIPPLVLQPKPKTDILDMAAAPGGKTTQIASLTHNEAYIMACEAQPIRAEKLKFNLEKQGTKNIQVVVNDARKLDEYYRFDQILLDAPCSGSGTIQPKDEKSYQYFTEKLIIKSQQTQIALLNKAIRLLKSGQTMVYSTCSILRGENEDVIMVMMKRHKIELIPIDLPPLHQASYLPTPLKHALLIAPNKYYEGFFIAHLRKK